MSVHNVLNEAQSEPIAMYLGRPHIPAAVKGLEYVWQIRWRNSDPSILYEDLHCSVVVSCVGAGLNPDPGRRTAVLDRVVKNVSHRGR